MLTVRQNNYKISVGTLLYNNTTKKHYIVTYFNKNRNDECWLLCVESNKQHFPKLTWLAHWQMMHRTPELISPLEFDEGEG